MTGAAVDGEVEDYQVSIVAAPIVQSVQVNAGQATRSEIASIEVQLAGDIPVSPSDFVLRNLTSGLVVSGMSVDRSFAEGITVATLRFIGGPSVISNNVSGVLRTLDSGTYQLRFLPSETDESSQPIDEFFRKFGDNDGDNTVGLSDFASFRAAFGNSFDADEPSNGFNSALDADRDGEIGLADFAVFRSSFGD